MFTPARVQLPAQVFYVQPTNRSSGCGSQIMSMKGTHIFRRDRMTQLVR